MARILIVYGTTEGHTRKISEAVGTWLRELGHDADVVNSAEETEPRLDQYAAFIVAGSLHQGAHQRELVEFVKAHAGELSEKPSALLSVSLTAVITDDKHNAEANQCIGKFIQETGWTPTITTPVAGALKYTQYDWLKRMLLRMISKKEGGDTDTSRDYEYTDWAKLREFIEGFLAEHVTMGTQVT